MHTVASPSHFPRKTLSLTGHRQIPTKPLSSTSSQCRHSVASLSLSQSLLCCAPLSCPESEYEQLLCSPSQQPLMSTIVIPFQPLLCTLRSALIHSSFAASTLAFGANLTLHSE